MASGHSTLGHPRYKHYWASFAASLLFLLSNLNISQAADRPNFLWVLSEDNSKHYLELFDDAGAPTPEIEKLADSGLIFDHAFSCAPVCSVARTTLMSGLYAPRVGTFQHRKIKTAALPDGWQLFPAYLREAGYYTTNRSKTDYNTSGNEGVWDESSNRASWRNRPSPDTPFFHMQTFGQSHESSLHFTAEQMATEKTETDPASVKLADIHPDTSIFRYTVARYHDRIRDIDRLVGELVGQLEADDLLEDTFIFYFGDHGGVLPGSKGYIHESGLHVPLVVRVPERWMHLAPMPRGSRVNGFVEFVDFGPTLLNLAGVTIPTHLDGTPFLGDNVNAAELNARDEAFGYADRFDEKYDHSRSLRKGRFKYVRHYQSYLPDALQNNYRYKMLAYQEWRDLFHEGKLNDAQRRFFEPREPEALYDIENDPWETTNLAADPAHRSTLLDLRQRLNARLESMPDLGFFPESVLVDQAMDNPVGFGQSHAEEIARMIDIADLALRPFDETRTSLEWAASSPLPMERIWTWTTCSAFGADADPMIDLAKAALTDTEPLVRVRAAEFLGNLGAADPVPTIREVLQTSTAPTETLITLNTVVFLQDGPHAYDFNLSNKDVPARNQEADRRMEYLIAE